MVTNDGGSAISQRRGDEDGEGDLRGRSHDECAVHARPP